MAIESACKLHKPKKSVFVLFDGIKVLFFEGGRVCLTFALEISWGNAILRRKRLVLKSAYKTIAQATPVTRFKEKGSVFLGYAFPIEHEGEVKPLLASLKKAHPRAGHFCYAWQLGVGSVRYSVSDDGEPSYSAGLPIYGQLRAFDLTQLLVVSVRFFGGTKLGVGGLMKAYKQSAQLSLAQAEIVVRTLEEFYQLRFAYALMNNVMRVVKAKKIRVVKQELDVGCVFQIAVRKNEEEAVLSRLETLQGVEIKKTERQM